MLDDDLGSRHNDYRGEVACFEAHTGLGWNTPTPLELARTPLSVVIPAHNSARTLPPVLDALALQACAAPIEVVAVDDGSTDATASILGAHPAVSTAVSLSGHRGAGAARNVGIYLAQSDTVVFLDSDIVAAPHVLADFSARASEHVVLLGFRQNVRYRVGRDGRVVLPAREPDLEADPRVAWRPRVDHVGDGAQPTWGAVERTLDDTHGFIDLGNGAEHFGWRLPQMAVTALMAASRPCLLDVGGFDPVFGVGWGIEDTYLGAAVIAAGCLVVPLRQARGFHIDPPDASEIRKAKLADLPRRRASYERCLEQPRPRNREPQFRGLARRLMTGARILR